MACSWSNEAGSRTETSGFFADVPKQPEILRLTLTTKKSTMWERFKSAIATLSPQELITRLNENRRKIQAKLDNGEKLTDDEIEFLNLSMEEQLTEILDKFKKQTIATTKIERTDTQEEMKFKLSVQKGLLDWLTGLFRWVGKKIKEIFEKINEKLEWCFEKAKELFKYLWSFFQQ